MVCIILVYVYIVRVGVCVFMCLCVCVCVCVCVCACAASRSTSRGVSRRAVDHLYGMYTYVCVYICVHVCAGACVCVCACFRARAHSCNYLAASRVEISPTIPCISHNTMFFSTCDAAIQSMMGDSHIYIYTWIQLNEIRKLVEMGLDWMRLD